MRVLWFTNIPLPAVARRLGHQEPLIGGWMGSLLAALSEEPGLEIAAASVSQVNYEPFTESGTMYFGIGAPPDRRGLKGVRDRWRHPIDFPDAMPCCLEIVDQFKPDLVHVHGTENFFGQIQSETALPVLISVQGLLASCVKFYFSGLRSTDIVRDALTSDFFKGSGLIHGYWRMRRAAQREAEIVRACSAFTGRTDWDRQFVSLLNPNAAYYHCNEMVRQPFYQAHWQPRAQQSNAVYYTAGAAPYKGLECLLEAVAIMRTSGWPGIQLRVGGAINNTPLWPATDRRMRELAVEDAVVWLGPVDADAIVRELLGASVYVQASRVDNSPNSLSEAMLVGAPCVAASVGGIPSMIRDEEEGLLFSSGDPYALAGKISRILNNPELAARLSERARATAHSRHDPGGVAATMMEIYRSLLETKRGFN